MTLILIPAVTWPATLDPSFVAKLAKMSVNDDIEVIVKLKSEHDQHAMKIATVDESRHRRTARVVRNLKETAELSQSKVRAALAREENSARVKKIKPFWIFNGFILTATAEGINQLAKLPDVAEISPNRIIKRGVTVSTATVTDSWNLAQIRAPELWAKGFTGQGAVVASLDTGVDLNHPALTSKWRGGANSWLDPYSNTATPYDTDGHGTAVTGLMVAGSTTDNPVGVAPGAKWMAAKIFSDAGNSDLAVIHAAFEWVLDPDGNPGTPDTPDVVNNSWDLDTPAGEYDAEFQGDIDVLRAAGIAVVFAAGNQGPLANSSTSPGNNPGAFPVGAVDSTGSIGYFSSRGPSAVNGSVYPALTAPGESIRSTAFLGGYAGFSGTSFSTPHVSGAIALLMSAIPGLTLEQVEEALKYSVEGPTGPNNTYGYGRLDVAKAYSYLALPGDVNGDGVVNVVDVLVLLNVFVDGGQTTPLIVRNGKVSPLDADSRPNRSGGAIGIPDALLVLQKALGIVAW